MVVLPDARQSLGHEPEQFLAIQLLWRVSTASKAAPVQRDRVTFAAFYVMAPRCLQGCKAWMRTPIYFDPCILGVGCTSNPIHVGIAFLTAAGSRASRRCAVATPDQGAYVDAKSGALFSGLGEPAAHHLLLSGRDTLAGRALVF